MISCNQVAKLLLSDQLPALSPWKRMEVKLHLAMCRLCSRLSRQVRQMGDGARRMAEDPAADGDFEERLIRRLSGE